MRIALRRKTDVKLVERREEVMAFVQRVAAVEVANMSDVVELLAKVDAEADALCLESTEDWGERLAIKRKGGGHHFDDDERATASRAYCRASLLHSSATWHARLVDGQGQIKRLVDGFRSATGGTALSRRATIERCTSHLTSVHKTLADIVQSDHVIASLKAMASNGIPQSVHSDAEALRISTVALAEYVHDQAAKELAGFRSETKMTQRFRANQAAAVCVAAGELLRGVASLAGEGAVPAHFVEQVAGGISELEAFLAENDRGSDFDEIDDEI